MFVSTTHRFLFAVTALALSALTLVGPAYAAPVQATTITTSF